MSWYAQTIDKSGRIRNYHLKITNTIPRTRIALLLLFDDVCRFAHIYYALDEFILQCWKRPVSRRFKRTWLMQFDIDCKGERHKVKTAAFNTQEKMLYELKRDYLYGDGRKLPPSPRLLSTSPDITAGPLRHVQPPMYYLQVSKSHRISATEKRIHPLYSLRALDRISKPMWRRPLTISWREGAKTKHSVKTLE